jgi:hypothetical protein
VSKSIKEIKKLERDSIIQLAFRSVQKLVGPTKTIEDFDKIIVLAIAKAFGFHFLIQ